MASAATRLLETLRQAQEIAHRGALARLRQVYDDVCNELTEDERHSVPGGAALSERA